MSRVTRHSSLVTALLALAATSASAGGAGFYRVECDAAGAWRLVDPAGEPTVWLGVDHVKFDGFRCEADGNRKHYREANERQFVSREGWATNTAERLRSWGFNGLGAACDNSRFKGSGLGRCVFLALGDSATAEKADEEHWLSDNLHTPGTAFPNVFHPDFEKTCDELARKRCAPNVGDPWLVGYFLDNELRWWGLGDSATGLFDLVRTLPPEHSARQALAAFLEERGLSTNSQCSQLPTNTNRNPANPVNPVENGSASSAAPREVPAATKRAFVALVAERYFSTLCAAIRKADPGHLILGSRFAGMDFAPEILAACGRHCDVVSVNVYPWADLDTGVVLEKRGGVPLADAFRAFREKAGGKPLLLTEWSFPALDSGLPCTYGAGQRFHTQVERAQASEMLLRTVMSLPFLVGDDFFMWQDDPALGFNKHFHENSNYGLVNVNDEPYAELTEMFARVHAEAPLIRAGAANRANGGASPPGEPPTSSPKSCRWKTSANLPSTWNISTCVPLPPNPGPHPCTEKRSPISGRGRSKAGGALPTVRALALSRTTAA